MNAKIIQLRPKERDVEIVLQSNRFKCTATLTLQEAHELIKQLIETVEDLENAT